MSEHRVPVTAGYTPRPKALHTCVQCGTAYETHQSRSRFCSRRCNGRWRTQNVGKGTRRCEVCGVEYVAGNNDQRTCSKECSVWARRGYPETLLASERLHGQHTKLSRCEACGAYVEHKPSRRWCDACSGSQHLAGTWIRGVKVCSDCGQPIAVYQGSGNYCASCARRRRPPEAKSDRKRARHAGVAYQYISRKRVFERDGWHCHICGKPTDKLAYLSRSWDHSQLNMRYPTLDHIVPLSAGGSHTYDNVACACWHCNCVVKGDRAVGEQLLLVG